MVKCLIGIPSIRDIPDFKEAIDKIPCDKLWIKYHREREAYRVMRKMFLGTKSYDYLIICPDDLIVTPKDYEILYNDVKEFDFPVIGGIFNISYDNRDSYAAARELVPYIPLTPQELFTGDPIKFVASDQFAFTFVRRDVVKMIEFHSKRYSSTAFDQAFALECDDHVIPKRIDVRANMLHLANRKGNGQFEYSGLGVKRPTMIFQPFP